MNSTTEPHSHEEAEIDVFPHPARSESSLLWLKLLSDVANDDSIPPILRLGDGQMPSSVYRHHSQPEAK
jgi:hypothetical protein